MHPTPKKVTAIAGIFFFLATSLPIPLSYSAQETPTSNLGLPTDLSQIVVPTEIGKIEQTSRGGVNGKTVVLIQDAHAIPDAQRNIEKLIGHFQKEYGINSVMVEGAASELDPQIFRSFPDKKILQEVFEEYRKNAELTGSTAAAIFNEQAGRYHGVEDWNLYEEGLYLYLLAMQNETELTQKLSVYEKDLQVKKQKAYSETLFEIDVLLNSFNENQADLVDVLKKLSAIREPEKGTELAALLDEVRNEGKDQSAVEIEVKRMAEKVSKLLSSGNGESKDKLRQFNEKFQEFQTSRISPQAFALFVKETILENRLPLKVSNRLLGLMGHQKTLRQIEGTKLFKDFETYATSIKDSLFQNEDQRKLDRETSRVHLLKKLIKLELSIEDWETLKKDSAALKSILPDDLLDAHRSFYENAEKRDHAFVSNITKQMDETKSDSSLLISGGFHTQGVNRELEEKGYSCVTIFPQIGSIPEHSLYQDHMAGQVSWKGYLQVEDGKIDVFKAFVRATRDRLVRGGGKDTGFLLKSWRDQIIRDLSAQGKIENASHYTKFIDEVHSSKEASPIVNRFARLDKFIEGLKSLQQKNEVTQKNVLQLLKAGTFLGRFDGQVLSKDPVRVDGNTGLKYENGRLIGLGRARPEVRTELVPQPGERIRDFATRMIEEQKELARIQGNPNVEVTGIISDTTYNADNEKIVVKLLLRTDGSQSVDDIVRQYFNELDRVEEVRKVSPDGKKLIVKKNPSAGTDVNTFAVTLVRRQMELALEGKYEQVEVFGEHNGDEMRATGSETPQDLYQQWKKSMNRKSEEYRASPEYKRQQEEAAREAAAEQARKAAWEQKFGKYRDSEQVRWTDNFMKQHKVSQGMYGDLLTNHMIDLITTLVGLSESPVERWVISKLFLEFAQKNISSETSMRSVMQENEDYASLMNTSIPKAVSTLLEIINAEGHSGYSFGVTLSLFNEVVQRYVTRRQQNEKEALELVAGVIPYLSHSNDLFRLGSLTILEQLLSSFSEEFIKTHLETAIAPLIKNLSNKDWNIQSQSAVALLLFSSPEGIRAVNETFGANLNVEAVIQTNRIMRSVRDTLQENYSFGAEQYVKQWLYLNLSAGKDPAQVEDALHKQLLPGLQTYEGAQRMLPMMGIETKQTLNSETEAQIKRSVVVSNYFMRVGTPGGVGVEGGSHIDENDPKQGEIRILPAPAPLLRKILDQYRELEILPNEYSYHTSIEGELHAEALPIMLTSFFMDIPPGRSSPFLVDNVLNIFGIQQSYIGATVNPRPGPEKGVVQGTQTNIYDKVVYQALVQFLEGVHPYASDLERKGLIAMAAFAYLKPESERTEAEQMLAQAYVEFKGKLRQFFASIVVSESEQTLIQKVMAQASTSVQQGAQQAASEAAARFYNVLSKWLQNEVVEMTDKEAAALVGDASGDYFESGGTPRHLRFNLIRDPVFKLYASLINPHRHQEYQSVVEDAVSGLRRAFESAYPRSASINNPLSPVDQRQLEQDLFSDNENIAVDAAYLLRFGNKEKSSAALRALAGLKENQELPYSGSIEDPVQRMAVQSLGYLAQQKRSEARAEMETVTLKNGAVEAKALVTVMMMSLERLIQEKPIVFYELVMKARDPKHQFFGRSGEDLKALNLVGADGNTMHDSIRNIVLSAAEGEGLDLSLTNPVRSELRQDARLVFDQLTQNNLDAPALVQLSDRVAQYDRDAVIVELERLKAEAERDAILLGETGATFLSFGAEQFANAVEELIQRLKAVSNRGDRKAAVGLVMPVQGDRMQIQRRVNRLIQFGVVGQVYTQGKDRYGVIPMLQRAGIIADPEGIKRDRQDHSRVGVIVPSREIVSGRVGKSFTLVKLTDTEKIDNPFINDYAEVLQEAVAL